MLEGEIDNINCLNHVLAPDENEKVEEKTRNSLALIRRYTEEVHLVVISSKLNKEEQRGGKIIWKLLKRNYADNNNQAHVLAFSKMYKISY